MVPFSEWSRRSPERECHHILIGQEGEAGEADDGGYIW